jgi:hypothetical protein
MPETPSLPARPQPRHLHVLHVLIRHVLDGTVRFLVYPHPRWKKADGKAYWALPAKKTAVVPDAAPWYGHTVEPFIEAIMQGDLGVPPDDYLLDQELEPILVEAESPSRGGLTRYEVCTADVWVSPSVRDRLAAKVNGAWLTPREILDHPDVSPTTSAVIDAVLKRETELAGKYASRPEAERRAEAPRRLLRDLPDRPTMDMLALRWHARNRGGVRCLSWDEARSILDAGDRAFNLLVADPYLRYQNQGYGLTFSLFTHKDRQGLHLHGAPIYEIYGVLSGGPLEVWSKPKHDRGAAAWSRKVVEPLGWAEVGPEHCHIVRWLGEGVGVVFKAGPGPLAGVGRQGACGKTPCGKTPNSEGCFCLKPLELIEVEKQFASGRTS